MKCKEQTDCKPIEVLRYNMYNIINRYLVFENKNPVIVICRCIMCYDLKQTFRVVKRIGQL